MNPMLQADLEDFPWVVVAMLVIGFFQWLVAQIKNLAAPQAPPSDETFSNEDFQPNIPPPVPVGPPPIPPPRTVPAAPRTLQDWRRILEAMQEVQQTPPPPVPVRKPEPPASFVSPPVAPRLAPSVPKTVPPSSAPTASTRAISRRITPQAIRDAVVLKEILDPPPGLREDGFR
ncbi:MAG: hypothetical protein KGS60_13085 [Verrucomicrobia bacterium]|nr:hypothetical protein [Verrucomicrobiota bacterium]